MRSAARRPLDHSISFAVFLRDHCKSDKRSQSYTLCDRLLNYYYYYLILALIAQALLFLSAVKEEKQEDLLADLQDISDSERKTSTAESSIGKCMHAYIHVCIYNAPKKLKPAIKY